MRREQLIEKILDIKRNKGWSWKHITEEIGGVSPIKADFCRTANPLAASGKKAD
jgi:hypothetical protein